MIIYKVMFKNKQDMRNKRQTEENQQWETKKKVWLINENDM